MLATCCNASVLNNSSSSIFTNIFNHSYNELPASSAIFPSHYSDHMIYIFIWYLEKGTQPDPWNIKLIWYGLRVSILDFIQSYQLNYCFFSKIYLNNGMSINSVHTYIITYVVTTNCLSKSWYIDQLLSSQSTKIVIILFYINKSPATIK